MTNRKHVGIYQLQVNAGRFDDHRSSASGQRPIHQLETYGEHARRTNMAKRERIKLIVQGFRQRFSHSAKNSRTIARSTIREVGAQVGLLASRKLLSLARRIEKKAEAIRPK